MTETISALATIPELRDWRFGDCSGESVPARDSDTYSLEVHGHSYGGVVIDIRHQANREFGAAITVEISSGVPMVHITNAVDGDMLVHIALTPEGVAVIPDQPIAPEKIPTARFYPGSRDMLTALYANDIEDDRGDLTHLHRALVDWPQAEA